MTTYRIEQKITAFTNQYKVYKGDVTKQGELIAFVQHKRMAMRENIQFFRDETKQKMIFQIKTASVMDAGATYNVYDDSDAILGSFKKAFSSSLLRSTWNILDTGTGEPSLTIRERSLPLAIFRRIWGFLPYIGEIPFLLKYHFDFTRTNTNEVVGTYEKTNLFRDNYKLQVNDEIESTSGWQVLVAMGVCLDALQSR